MIGSRSSLKLFLGLLAAGFSCTVPLQAQLTQQDLMLLGYWVQNSSYPPAPAQTSYAWSVAAHANPDECFYGLAGYLNSPTAQANNASFLTNYPNDLSPEAIANCILSGGSPKINQAYVWGLTATPNGDVWIGTVANTLCLVLDNMYGPGASPDATLNNEYVCDAKNNPIEDYKPPRMYVYQPAGQSLMDLTPLVFGDPNLFNSSNPGIGLRSAGTSGDVVFFGGVNLPANNVVLFAFDAANYKYLGSQVFDGSGGKAHYTDIRQWHVYNGQLYTGVATPTGGQILRWTGSLSDPFKFEVVGNVGGDPAYFTLHTVDNRMYVSTWPVEIYGPPISMSIWMSPALHGEALALADTDANLWTKAWDLSKYEVEPSAQQAGGAIVSYGGYLYFGTMHVPGSGEVAFNYLYGSSADPTAALLGSYRPIVLFRSKGFAVKNPSVQLLYGNTLLPKYNARNKSWSLVKNNLKQQALYGTAGFGNLFNNYTWAAEVYNNQLFIGTMDFSYLLTDDTSFAGFSLSNLPPILQRAAQQSFGADLWYFTSTSKPAQLINSSGLGNFTSYGIRNLVATPDGLWTGMANPMNLRNDPANNPGGWKLILFK